MEKKGIQFRVVSCYFSFGKPQIVAVVLNDNLRVITLGNVPT